MKFAQQNGRSIAYQDQGNGAALVFSHAFALNQSMWEEQTAHFSRTRRVVTFDWRGFGSSSGAGDTISMEDLADDLAALIDHLDLDMLSLCGLSMGGYAIFAFQRKYPTVFNNKVISVILADTKATIEDQAGREARLSMAARAEFEGSRAIAETVVPRWVSQSTFEGNPGLVSAIKEMVAGTPAASIAAAQRGMALRLDSTQQLAEMKCPVLVLVGSEDQLTPPTEAEWMARNLPDATLSVIAGAGHLASLECPTKFNQAIEDWGR